MSEESSENLQQILNLQVQIAAGMKLQSEVVEFLKSIQDWGKREWYYICALDRMPVSSMKEMEEKKYSITKIRKARQDYLIQTYSSLDMVSREVEKLKKEAAEVFEESRNIRNTIMDNLETALEKQAAAQQETIKTKDNMIEMLKKQMEVLEMELEERKESPSIYPEKKQEPKILFQTAPSDMVRSEPVGSGNEKAEIKKQGVLEDGRRAWVAWRRQTDVKHFVDKYIKGQDLSDEQKDFLLECLESGMKPADVAELAAPGLSLDVMKRLKELKFKDRSGGVR